MAAQNFYPNMSRNVTYPDYVPKPPYPSPAIWRWHSKSTSGINCKVYATIFWDFAAIVWPTTIANESSKTLKCKKPKFKDMLSKIIPLVDCSVLRQCHMCVGSWNLGPFVTSNKANSVVVVVRLSIYQDYGIKTIYLVQYNYKIPKIRSNGPILSQTMLIVG